MVPRSDSRPARAATNVLLILPIEKSVSAVGAVCVETTASPDSPVQIDPSGNTTAAVEPGTLEPAVAASSTFCSATCMAGVSCVADVGAGVARSEVGTGTMEASGTGVGDGVGEAVGAG